MKPRRRWFRFGLRTFLIVAVAFAFDLVLNHLVLASFPLARALAADWQYQITWSCLRVLVLLPLAAANVIVRHYLSCVRSEPPATQL